LRVREQQQLYQEPHANSMVDTIECRRGGGGGGQHDEP
jgi:hypothetical protein